MAKITQNVEKIMLAGMKLLYAKETSAMRESLLQGPSVEKLASNVVGLVKLMWDKSGGKMPPDAIPLAAMMLVYELAGFMREAGHELTQEDVEDAVALSMQMLKEMFAQLIPSMMGNGMGGQQQNAQAQPMSGLLAQKPRGAMMMEA